MMVANMGHGIPGPDGGPGLPFVNWSTTGGDLRIAHFLGLHALQMLPALGWALDRGRASAPDARRRTIAVGGALWLALMAVALWLAVTGRPLLP